MCNVTISSFAVGAFVDYKVCQTSKHIETNFALIDDVTFMEKVIPDLKREIRLITITKLLVYSWLLIL